MNIEEIPLPPEARTGSIEGRYEIRLDAATNVILSELKRSYSKTQEKILFLTPETNAAQIFEFYEPRMTQKGFSKFPNVPKESSDYLQAVWKNEDRAVSVAVIEAGTDAAGKPIKFLAIHTGSN